MKTTRKKKEVKKEEKKVDANLSVVISEVMEEKEEVKKITGKKLKDFKKFAEIMKVKTPGNFRQRAEAAGVAPEDVYDFKYWLRDNSE